MKFAHDTLPQRVVFASGEAARAVADEVALLRTSAGYVGQAKADLRQLLEGLDRSHPAQAEFVELPRRLASRDGKGAK